MTIHENIKRQPFFLKNLSLIKFLQAHSDCMPCIIQHVFMCVNIFISDFVRYIQSLMEILEFLDKNPDDYKVLGE